jgi:hypothetical protein
MWNFLEGVERPAKRTKTVPAAAAEAVELVVLSDSTITRRIVTIKHQLTQPNSILA